MSLSSDIHNNGQDIDFFGQGGGTTPLAITAAVTALTTNPVKYESGMKELVVEAALTYGSGGTTVDVWVQTSVDGGTTWTDIMNFHFTTASATKISAVNANVALAAATALTDGTLASNTILNGLLGSQLRLKYTTTGTYAGSTTLAVKGVAKG